MEQQSPGSSLTMRASRLIRRSRLAAGPWFGLQAWRRGFARDEVSPVRLASHLALLAVIVLVWGLTRIQWPERDISWRLPAPLFHPMQPDTPGFRREHSGPRTSLGGSLLRAAVPITQVPERSREGITTYVVVPGDTLSAIAQRFKVSVDTIKWANGLELNPDLLRVGQELIILPVSGVYHVVEEGETLAQIARRYKVKPEVIVEYKGNNLKSIDEPLPAGKVLIIPGGEKPWVTPYVSAYSGPIPTSSQKGTGRFVWPTSGRITALFGQLVQGKPHEGLDIGAPMGTPVVASDSGYVTFAGWDRTGFGNLVILNHGNGYLTYYGHLSKIMVKEGDTVAQGQRIGLVGASGNSTGPHLDFRIRENNVFRNPLGFLP